MKQGVHSFFFFKTLFLLVVAMFPLCILAGSGHGSHHHSHVAGPPSLSKASLTTTVFDNKGRLWLAWVFGQDLYVNYSDDRGKSFSEPVQVDGKDEVVSANPEARPNIAVTDEGIVFVSYAEKLKKRFSGHIRFSRSIDGGKSFSTPIIVNDDRQMIGHSFGALEVNRQGEIYMTWLDSRERVAAKKAGEEYIGSSVFYARSLDGGKSFEPNIKIADNSCQCCRISVTLDQNDLPVLVWRHIFGKNTRDHAMVRFTSETEFVQPRQVSDDQWQIDACPHHGPSLVVDQQGRYHMTWFTNGKVRQGVFYAYSDDQGVSFSEPMRVGTVDEPAKHAYLLERDGQVHLTWKAFNGEETTLYVMHSADRGVTWGAARSIVTTQGQSDHPFLLNHHDDIYLSWQTANEGFQLLALDEQTVSKEETSLNAFVLDSYQKIIESRQAPFIVNLWSIDCPPCRKELVMLRELSQQYPQLDVVLISTDEPEYRSEVLDVMNELGLGQLEAWHFDDPFVERLRFAIDKTWFGELPRTYFYSLEGEVEAVSGIVELQKLTSWMQQNLMIEVVQL